MIEFLEASNYLLILPLIIMVYLSYRHIKTIINKVRINAKLKEDGFTHIFSGKGENFIAFNLETNHFQFGNYYKQEVNLLHASEITDYEWKRTIKGAQKVTNKFLFNISHLEHYMHEVFYQDAERLAEKDWSRIKSVFQNFNSYVNDYAEQSNLPKEQYDFFISHASEDKDSVVRPLVNALHQKGVTVWYDEFSLKVGDSLRETIDLGLKNSKYGIVVLSESFFLKKWPEYELNSLHNKSMNGKNAILPVWHQVDQSIVSKYSLSLGEKMALSTDKNTPDMLAEKFAKLINQQLQ